MGIVDNAHTLNRNEAETGVSVLTKEFLKFGRNVSVRGVLMVRLHFKVACRRLWMES